MNETHAGGFLPPRDAPVEVVRAPRDELLELDATAPPCKAAVVRRRRVYFACKRSLDLVVATTVLLLATPLLVLIAVAIKLDSPGPVLFRHERVGSRRRSTGGAITWETRPFQMWKFRTMRSDADNSVHEAHIRAFVEGRLGGENGNGNGNGATAPFKLQNDPRITRVGRTLRRLSLDELPQLVNVIAGTMSLVGPRPVPPYEASLYPSVERFAAKPGVTGLWQVRGRCDLPFEKMKQLDLSYVRSQSLTLDLKILALTVPAVLSGRGAG